MPVALAVGAVLLVVGITAQRILPVEPAAALQTATVPAETPEFETQTAALDLLDGQGPFEPVSRNAAIDLLTMVPEAPAVPQELVSVINRRDPRDLTPAEIELRTQEATKILRGNKLRMLREGVLAGIYRIEAVEENGIRKIKLRTPNAEVSRKTLTELLTRAAAEGRIELPPSLSTTAGGIDMDTMLFHLLQASLATDGTPEGTAAALDMTRRAFAAAAQSTTTASANRDADGDRTYVVERGDSLAYISLQFYGKPNEYPRIFQANRNILQSPDTIWIGQRLKIPS